MDLYRKWEDIHGSYYGEDDLRDVYKSMLSTSSIQNKKFVVVCCDYRARWHKWGHGDVPAMKRGFTHMKGIYGYDMEIFFEKVGDEYLPLTSEYIDSVEEASIS